MQSDDIVTLRAGSVARQERRTANPDFGLKGQGWERWAPAAIMRQMFEIHLLLAAMRLGEPRQLRP